MPDWRSAAAWLTTPNRALREESVFDKYRVGTDPQTGISSYIPEDWSAAKAAWTTGKRLLSPMTSPLGAGMTLAGAAPSLQGPLMAAGVPLGAMGAASSLREGDYPGAAMNLGFMGLSGLPLAMRAAFGPTITPPPGMQSHLPYREAVDQSRRAWMTRPADVLRGAASPSTSTPTRGGVAGPMTRREFGKKTAQAAAGATAAVAGIRGVKGPGVPAAAPAAPVADVLVGARKYTYGDPMHTGIQEVWETPTGYKTVTKHYMTDESYGASQTDLDLPEWEWGNLQKKLGPEKRPEAFFLEQDEQVLGKALEDIEGDPFSYMGRFDSFEDPAAGRAFTNIYDRVNFSHPEYGPLGDWGSQHPESIFLNEIEGGPSGRYSDKRLIWATFNTPEGGLVNKRSARPVTQKEAAELVGPDAAEHMFSQRSSEAAMTGGNPSIYLGSHAGHGLYANKPVKEEWWVPSSIKPKHAPRLGRATRKLSEGDW